MNQFPQIISYEEWCERNFIEEEEENEIVCERCGGDGSYECKCCGQDVECNECDGRGFVNISLSKTEYEERVKLDIKKWKEHHDTNKKA